MGADAGGEHGDSLEISRQRPHDLDAGNRLELGDRLHAELALAGDDQLAHRAGGGVVELGTETSAGCAGLAGSTSSAAARIRPTIVASPGSGRASPIYRDINRVTRA